MQRVDGGKAVALTRGDPRGLYGAEQISADRRAAELNRRKRDRIPHTEGAQ